MLKVGQYVVAYGFKVKNDNDIYVVKNDYGNNSYCLYKVKLNGEESNVKYRILFLDKRHFDDSAITIKPLNSVEDLKIAKAEVNAFLKGVTDKEIVVSYSPADSNAIIDNGVIQVIKSIPTTKSIYNMPKGYYQIELLNNDRVVFKRLGKKGQPLSSLTETYNMIVFGTKTVKQLINEEYMILVNKHTTTKGELDQQSKKRKDKQHEKDHILTTSNESEEQPTINETEQEQDNTNQETEPQENENAGVTIALNEEMNGIEISFDSKPDQAILEQLKANGFRWSNRQKIWYAKQSSERLQFAESLGTITEQTADKEPITYPEINIDDIETYTIDKQLQQREHDSNWVLRKNEINRTKEIQAILLQYNNQAKELLTMTDDPATQYRIKRTIQSFKKKYYDIYVKMLTHKANNPSWAVTGRAGVNAARYNKMVDRYHNMLGESVQLTDKIEKDLSNIKRDIRRKETEKVKQEVNSNLEKIDQNNMPKFEIVKLNIEGYAESRRGYKYGGYTIVKSWGMFRIFDNKGKEVETTLNTTSKLTDAKAYVIYLVQQEQNKSETA